MNFHNDMSKEIFIQNDGQYHETSMQQEENQMNENSLNSEIKGNSLTQQLENITNFFKKTKTDDKPLNSKIKRFLIDLSDSIDSTFDLTEKALQNINMKKGFSYEDEIRMQFNMNNLDPYPSLEGVSIEDAYIVNLNSRFSKTCSNPEPQDIVVESVQFNQDQSTLFASTSRVSFKRIPNSKSEMVCYTLNSKFPQPMREILNQPAQLAPTCVENCSIWAVSYCQDKGESNCMEWQLEIGEGNNNAIRVDHMRLRETDSEMGSLLWGSSQFEEIPKLQSLSQYRGEEYFKDTHPNY